VLGLREQVGGDPGRISAVVGDDRHLGGTGHRIDADVAEHQPLGGRHVSVAGADDLVDARHALGSVGEGCHRLRAADDEHAVDAGDLGGGQRLGRWTGRRHDDLGDAGDARRDRRHQHRRRVARGAAGRVDTDAAQRAHARADARAAGVQLEGWILLLRVEGLDALRGALQRCADRRGDGGRLRLPARAIQLQRVQLAALELLGQRAHRSVTARAHLRDHLARGVLDRGRHRRASPAQRLQCLFVSGIGFFEKTHRFRPGSIGGFTGKGHLLRSRKIFSSETAATHVGNGMGNPLDQGGRDMAVSPLECGFLSRETPSPGFAAPRNLILKVKSHA
jgi:hypothetical protein